VTFGRRGIAKPMGAWLKETLGPDYVNLGFAFNQGSFQAMDLRNQRGLVPFTLAPAPEGSIDATLARAGFPLAVIDLRALPARGDVHDWWFLRHPARSIGAVYAAESADEYFLREAPPLSYDGLVFVESTTAARSNPSGIRAAPVPPH